MQEGEKIYMLIVSAFGLDLSPPTPSPPSLQGVDSSGTVSEQELDTRLDSPVTTSNMDPDKVNFERQKSGIWGFQSERSEDIGGFSCKARTKRSR